MFQNNTFQCNILTNGSTTLVLCLYPEERIGWTTGNAQGGVNGLGGSPAIVGVDTLTDMVRVVNSGTNQIVDVEQRSNVNAPGVYVFRVDGSTILQPDSKLFYSCDCCVYASVLFMT